MCTIDIKTQTAPSDKGCFEQNPQSTAEKLTKEIVRLLATASPKALRCVYVLLLRME